MKHDKLILLMFPVLFLGASLFFTTPVNATCPEGQVETNFFGCVEDDKQGCGVWMVINLGLTILTYGVGIAATIGLVITAILYLTARDDSGQLAKAKTRVFEIVIGLAIYAATWSIVSWLIPGGLLNGGDICSTSTPSAGSSSSFKGNMAINNGGDNDKDSDDPGTGSDTSGDLTGKKEYKKSNQLWPLQTRHQRWLKIHL